MSLEGHLLDLIMRFLKASFNQGSASRHSRTFTNNLLSHRLSGVHNVLFQFYFSSISAQNTYFWLTLTRVKQIFTKTHFWHEIEYIIYCLFCWTQAHYRYSGNQINFNSKCIKCTKHLPVSKYKDSFSKNIFDFFWCKDGRFCCWKLTYWHTIISVSVVTVVVLVTVVIDIKPIWYWL